MNLGAFTEYWRKAVLKTKNYVTSPQARELERELAAVRDEKQTLHSELSNVHAELDGIRSRDKEERNELEQRIGHIEAERDAAHLHIQTLQNSLADAASRLDSTETRVNLLDTRFQKERSKHQSELQETRERTRQQARRLNWAMMVAGLAFLLGTMASVTKTWDTRNNAHVLTELSRDIKDIKASMQQQLGSMRESLEEYQLSLFSEKVCVQTHDAEQGVTGKWQQQQERTATDTIKSSSTYKHHPHIKHRTKPEMQVFFEENAGELGVISLSSGLQYRVLSRGSGKSPKSTDRVVFDYRAFLPDGTELYNSYKEGEPIAFSIDQVMPGLQEALLRMAEGAQWELYIPPALAYQGGTRKRRKYGYEPLIYTVELKSVIEGGESIEN
jgi:FKBP-type peptidyl-prolyl cis-trans isomerase